MFETVLISTVALVFIVEGLLPFAFPNFWRKMIAEAIMLEERKLRLMGLVSISIGMAILFFFQ